MNVNFDVFKCQLLQLMKGRNIKYPNSWSQETINQVNKSINFEELTSSFNEDDLVFLLDYINKILF